MYYMDELFISFKIIYMNIPNEDVNILKILLWLTAQDKRKLLKSVEESQLWLSSTKLRESNPNLESILSKWQLEGFFDMYFRLVMSKEYSGLSLEEFLNEFWQSLINNNGLLDEPIDNYVVLVEELINNWEKILHSSKAMEALFDNQRILVNFDIYQDIRPFFSKTWDVLWAVSFYNLKLKYKEGSPESKEFYITLDSNDLDDLIDELQLVQKRGNKVKESLNQIKLIDIK